MAADSERPMAMGREAAGWRWRDCGGHGVSGRSYRAGWWCYCGEPLRMSWPKGEPVALVCDAGPVVVAVGL